MTKFHLMATRNRGTALVLALSFGVTGVLVMSPSTTAPPTVAAAADGFVSMTPTRILDTRSGSGLVAAGDSVTATLTGIPADAAAAVVNVTAANATGNGYLTVWDCDGPAPGHLERQLRRHQHRRRERDHRHR